MSVRTGFAIVGTAIGAYFGNAQLGFAIGSMVGGYVDPIKNKGPRLTDAQQQTSQDGVAIPITYGTVRISGNIIATDGLKEHKNKDNGKGSGTETTTYTYSRTYAIGICEGPIGGIRRIWRDGKLVYDQSPASIGNYESRASTRQFLSKSSQYIGDELQMPDSALQAVFGAENVPAFRGLAYVVIRDDDLTDRGGSIPQWEFEILQAGTPSESGEYIAPYLPEPRWKYPGAPLGADPRIAGASYRYGVKPFGVGVTWYNSLGECLDAIGRGDQMMGWSHDYTVTGSGSSGGGPNLPVAPFEIVGEPQSDLTAILGLVYSVDPFGSIVLETDITLLTPEKVTVSGIYVGHLTSGPVRYGSGVVSNTPNPNSSSTPLRVGSHTYYYSPSVTVACQVITSCALNPDPTWVEIPGTPGFYVDQTGQIHETGNCEPTTGAFHQLQLLEYTSSEQSFFSKLPTGPVLEVGAPLDTEAFWLDVYEDAKVRGAMADGLVYGVDYPAPVSVACFCATSTVLDPQDPILATIVADLCFRKGLQGSEIDVAQLTDVVKGFTVATATSAADAINALAPAYMFDEAEWDGRIRFIKRGGATVAALSADDAFDSDNGRIIETRAQELELPRKMTLSYMDIDANYAVTTQTAERYAVSVASSGTDQVQLTVVMDSDKAAQVADILLKDQWAGINGTLELSVGDAYSALVPTDTLFLTFEEAVFRTRVVDAANADGIIKLNLQQDTASAYSSAATGVPPIPPQEGDPTIIGPTFAEVMNLPALRDQDDRVGLYIAACGPVGTWRGCQVSISIDGGQTWTDILQITQSATIGVLSSALGDWSEHIPDSVHKMEVALTDGDFSSVTLDQMYSGANALCVGDEILQFETELLISPKNYELAGSLFRGRKNTGPELWPSQTRVVGLDSAYFLPLDRSFVGLTLTFRMTSFGTDVQYGTLKTVNFSVPKSVQEWPVTDIRSGRAVDQALTLSWVPRHRFGTSRAPYPSSSFTGYRLIITNGTVTHTINTVAQVFNYSAADQVTDFGSAGPLTVTIYAMNSIIGPGEGETVNV